MHILEVYLEVFLLKQITPWITNMIGIYCEQQVLFKTLLVFFFEDKIENQMNSKDMKSQNPTETKQQTGTAPEKKKLDLNATTTIKSTMNELVTDDVRCVSE